MQGKSEGGTDRSWEQVFSDMVLWKFDEPPPDWAVLSDVGFMQRALELTQGARLLDLGCGFAHHSIELARRGCEVTGLEWSEACLEVARRRAAEAAVHIALVRGDMTRLTFQAEFDAAVLWGNTFGMFAHEDNLRTLEGIRRALKPGGRALIDTQNQHALPDRLEAGWHFHKDDPNLLFLTRGTRDVLRGRFGFTVLAIDLASGRRHEMPLSWRLYLLPELEKIVAEAGLTLVGVFGDDPGIADWKSWRKGEAHPYCVEAFTENAAKRILLCRA